MTDQYGDARGPNTGGAPIPGAGASASGVETPKVTSGGVADALRRRRILYAVNVDWFFLSHRLPLAAAARRSGAEVALVAGDTGRGEEIRAAGIEFIPIRISRGGTNPVAELGLLRRLLEIYRRRSPDLVHHVTIKPVIYGSVAARLAGTPAVVNAVSGLGYSFSDNARARLLRPLVLRLYRAALAHPNSRTIFQNEDDLARFVGRGLLESGRAVLIRGSGVDCDVYTPGAPPDGPPIVLLSSRLLWDKGVGEFVEAARRVRATGSSARFVLVGAADDENPTAVSRRQLERWNAEGAVEWWGFRSDMPDILRQASIVVLPSRYPEGVPKALIEAAAAGLPLIATDAPGCRDIVRNGLNGVLVPAGDIHALGDAIARLLADANARRRLGRAGRALVEAEFALPLVIERTLAVYGDLLSHVPLRTPP